MKYIARYSVFFIRESHLFRFFYIHAFKVDLKTKTKSKFQIKKILFFYFFKIHCKNGLLSLNTSRPQIHFFDYVDMGIKIPNLTPISICPLSDVVTKFTRRCFYLQGINCRDF
jgi:hypothetical protein